jgi:hypothetical protein
MTDTSNSWKVRTETIDKIMGLLSEKIETDPDQVKGQTETISDFIVSLLLDQNFKIVLTSLLAFSKYFASTLSYV